MLQTGFRLRGPADRIRESNGPAEHPIFMSLTQQEKPTRFRELHEGPGAFVIPNPWDIASARMLAGLGFRALATSSAASATALGKRDGGLTREEALAHARSIVDATHLPVSADLEDGLGEAHQSGD